MDVLSGPEPVNSQIAHALARDLLEVDFLLSQELEQRSNLDVHDR